MQVIKKRLKAFLKGSTRIALLGVGSELCGDDAAGIMVAHRLDHACRKRKSLAVFFGFSAPENLTGPIKKFAPQRLIIVDTANFKALPGEVKIIPIGKTGGVSFSTHRLPLKVIADYLLKTARCKTLVIAIKPKSVSYGAAICAEVKEATSSVFGLIKEVINNEGSR